MKASVKKKYLLRMIAGIFITLVAYVLVVILLSFISTNPEPQHCPQKEEIYISFNGVHLDFLFPKELVDKALVEALEVPDEVPYLAFGWGDKGFYLETPTWAELKPGVALRAVFLKSETAMHVTYWRRHSPSWETLFLCRSQIDPLLSYISASFERDGEGRIIEIPDSGYTGDDRFFEAVGSYSLLKTCNDWINIGLKRAKVKTAIRSPFGFGVLHHVRKNKNQ